ncbi:MAG: hypothetical protein K0R55_1819 [Sporomusa sp.]|nr:hypothetical protein [Sporomusa sp.]
MFLIYLRKTVKFLPLICIGHAFAVDEILYNYLWKQTLYFTSFTEDKLTIIYYAKRTDIISLSFFISALSCLRLSNIVTFPQKMDERNHCMGLFTVVSIEIVFFTWVQSQGHQRLSG